jgi:RNA polymerase sigma-70 factor (ECF subfamily)
MPSERLVLACALTGEALAWEEFVRRFRGLISITIVRTAGRWGTVSPEVVDELVQETYLKLYADSARLLRTFKPRCPDAVYGYLRVLTANLVHDHFKALHSQKRGGSRTIALEGTLEAIPDRFSRASNEQGFERNVLLREIDSCLRSLISVSSDRDRRIFWLYYRAGLTASAIAELPSISLTTKGVESTIFRLTREVRDRLTGSKVRALDRAAGEGIESPESL